MTLEPISEVSNSEYKTLLVMELLCLFQHQSHISTGGESRGVALDIWVILACKNFGQALKIPDLLQSPEAPTVNFRDRNMQF